MSRSFATGLVIAAVETVVLMGRAAHGSLFSRPSAHDRAVAAQRTFIAHRSRHWWTE